jgi:hypothetical protein
MRKYRPKRFHQIDPQLHFVDPRDNSVMDVKEILRLIDYRTEQLDPLFREFNVLHTVSA